MSKLFKWFRNDAEKVNDEHTPTTPEEPVNSEKAVVDNLTQLDDEESLAVAPSMTDSAELIESVDTSIELADDVEVTTVEKQKLAFFRA